MKHDQPRDPPEDLSKRVHALSDGELQAAIKGPKRTTNPLFCQGRPGRAYAPDDRARARLPEARDDAIKYFRAAKARGLSLPRSSRERSRPCFTSSPSARIMTFHGPLLRRTRLARIDREQVMTDKSMAVQVATCEVTNAAMLAARGCAAEAKQEFEMAEAKQTAAKVRLAQLHQLNARFAIFGASDRDKSLDLKGLGLRKRLWCRPSALRGRGRSANLRHVFALQDLPQGRQGPSGMVGCRKSARS